MERKMKGYVLIEVLALLLLCGCAMGKECSNTVPNKSLQFEIASTKNETWKQQILSQFKVNTVYEKPTKVSKGSTLNWEKISNQITNAAKFNPPQGLLKEVSLHDVRLEPNSLHWTAQQTNLEYLMMLDVDRLVWSFRKTAGLPTLGTPYGGWEAPDIELRGHFVGHYLSAAAKMWASTQNGTLQEKMSAVVSILSDCQQKMGTGYLSAFPSELFDRYEAVVYVWAPYYTIHKIMSGLLDQHTIAKNPQALKMLTWMVDYFYNRIQNVILQFSIARHYAALNEETGGMNDLLYRLYSITKDPKHLVMAHLFDKPCFLGELAVQANNLADFHANTHIPVVIGSQMRYEVTGDPLYKSIATYFMDIVNSTHTFATGGTSIDEHWKEPSRLASHLMPENEESCTTYNMLKVSRNLFRWTKETAYADHYERALTNGVLSIQRGTEPGVMIYFLPLGPGHSKAVSNHGWGTPFDSFWCCYGTAIESFSKLGDSIYFEEEGKVPSLYIIQYISSSLNWVSGQIVLNQKVDPVVSWDPFLKVTITTSTLQNSKEGNRLSTLNLRIPIWTNLNDAKAELNNINLKLPAPGNFLSITRYWAPNDTLNLQLPIDMRLEAIKDDRPEYASIKAILYGPYLLAGHSSGNWDITTGNASSISDWITPIPSTYNNHLVTFSQQWGNSIFFLMNSSQIITMGNSAQFGNNSALQATFRLIFADQSSSKVSSIKDAIGKSVMLEPFDYPGMLVVAHADRALVIGRQGYSAFHLVPGLDARKGTVSLESETLKGCFVYGGATNNSSMALKCNLDTSNSTVAKAASFVMHEGMSKYHPISFVAKGATRNFLLEPLLKYKNETYTVYFNIQA
ncbi:hypothetical protein P3X46_023965 [Hevea brasiliensis]|uniref:Alpha-L-arabinofuranosidase B arabinose-binding domain-containing protein n=1 Tax=Hevea brasiliensis TaxID=3981 RepID=A0ABQ9LCL5_HEVBR|nr:uncharacterized protein LOC110633841 [Hevea brasiliensis]KAJ9164385.1 hypothetical protein P3X46_023965 [Hevea brasiliensis]